MFQNQFKGSEHRIDGKQTASEMHMVHHKTKYADLGAALKGGEEDALAVVGVMLTKANRAAAGHETVIGLLQCRTTTYEIFCHQYKKKKQFVGFWAAATGGGQNYVQCREILNIRPSPPPPLA